MFAQPRIAAPAFSNAMVPHRLVLLVPAVAVAMSVTLSLVTAAAGVASKSFVVVCEATGIGEATTTAVLVVVTEALPQAPVAVTTQAIVLPMSAADRA
jgi:hypothetical protein